MEFSLLHLDNLLSYLYVLFVPLFVFHFYNLFFSIPLYLIVSVSCPYCFDSPLSYLYVLFVPLFVFHFYNLFFSIPLYLIVSVSCPYCFDSPLSYLYVLFVPLFVFHLYNLFFSISLYLIVVFLNDVLLILSNIFAHPSSFCSCQFLNFFLCHTQLLLCRHHRKQLIYLSFGFFVIYLNHLYFSSKCLIIHCLRKGFHKGFYKPQSIHHYFFLMLL